MIKAYWEVTAGMFGGDVDPTLTRRWELTAEQIQSGEYVATMFAALGYVAELQLRSASGMMPNAVLCEFCWV